MHECVQSRRIATARGSHRTFSRLFSLFCVPALLFNKSIIKRFNTVLAEPKRERKVRACMDTRNARIRRRVCQHPTHCIFRLNLKTRSVPVSWLKILSSWCQTHQIIWIMIRNCFSNTPETTTTSCRHCSGFSMATTLSSPSHPTRGLTDRGTAACSLTCRTSTSSRRPRQCFLRPSRSH